MKTWKKVLIVFSAIAVVAIACFISWSCGFREGIRAGGLTSSMAEFMLTNQHMADQLANANCEGVKQALTDHLKHLDKYRNLKGSFISGTVYFGDKRETHLGSDLNIDI